MAFSPETISFIQEYGYPLILLWTFIEGESCVVIAGYLAQKGIFNPWLISLVAFCGTFMSDQLMFTLGRWKGPNILKRFPKLEKNTEKARALLHRHETGLILGFRFVYGIRNVTPILMGTSGVDRKKFFFLNMIAAIVWSISFTFGGYYFGELFTKASEYFANAEYFLIAIILMIILFFRIRSRRRKERVNENI